MCASAEGHHKVVELLIVAGAKIDHRSEVCNSLSIMAM